MRQVMNISLPAEMLMEVKSRAKAQKYSTLSEYVRHLIRLENTEMFAKELEEDRKEFDAGHYKVLGSLKDLR